MANKKKNDVVESNVDVLSLKNDLVNYIDGELDKKIDSMFNQKIRNEFIEEIDNSNRRLVREKNKKIIFRDIIIVILIVAIFYLTHLLYEDNYFDKYFSKNNDKDNINDIDNNKVNDNNQVVEDVNSLEKLKSEYGILLNNVIISRSSRYIEDYYSGNLSDELKKYLVLNSINFDKLEVEDDYNVISADTFSLAYKKLFDGSFEHSNFDYNGNRVRYFNKLDSYITDSLLVKDELLIMREISSIAVINDNVVIETVEGIVGTNKLFNVLSLEEIIPYNGDSLLNYQEALNKVVYTFKKNGKLVSINAK